MKWFFIRCQSGREDTIAKNSLARLKMSGVTDLVPQVLVPFERVTDLKNGKKRVVNKKLYPGYLMVQADLDDATDDRVLKARNTLREIDGLREFLGPLLALEQEYPLAGMDASATVEVEVVNCNWKVFIHAFTEAYHLNVLHRQTLGNTFNPADNPNGDPLYYRGFGQHGCLTIGANLERLKKLKGGG